MRLVVDQDDHAAARGDARTNAVLADFVQVVDVAPAVEPEELQGVVQVEGHVPWHAPMFGVLLLVREEVVELLVHEEIGVRVRGFGVRFMRIGAGLEEVVECALPPTPNCHVLVLEVVECALPPGSNLGGPVSCPKPTFRTICVTASVAAGAM